MSFFSLSFGLGHFRMKETKKQNKDGQGRAGLGDWKLCLPSHTHTNLMQRTF